jgi:hypothetical protein
LAREPLARPEEAGAPTWAQTQTQAQAEAEPAEIVWCRAYRLTVGGAPVFAITEWFCRSVLTALQRSPSG